MKLYVTLIVLFLYTYRLGCINVETVGIKHQKVSKHNICRWCGNPWGSGDLSISIKKTAKSNQIKKFLKKNQGDTKKLNNFQKRMLERYTKTPSSLLIKCTNCLKTTVCNIPLPPKSELTSKKQVVNTNSTTAANTDSALSKKKKKNKQQQQKQNAQSAKKSLATIKSSGKSKKPLSKSQLKNIAKGIKSNASAANQSSLQRFLNSVK